MNIKPIIAISFSAIALGSSLPAFAESSRVDREISTIKVETLNRRNTELKAKQCNIQCITTPCPCTDKPTTSDNRNQRGEDRKDKLDRNQNF